MRSVLSCLAHLAKAARARGPAHRLAELDDHTLSDIGLRRTDLYAFRNLHRSRIEAPCCRLGEVALSLLAGRPASCC